MGYSDAGVREPEWVTRTAAVSRALALEKGAGMGS